MSWYSWRRWIFAWSWEKGGGDVTQWTARGREDWVRVVGKLWIRVRFIPVGCVR
jgi:hypothetical protein